VFRRLKAEKKKTSIQRSIKHVTFIVLGYGFIHISSKMHRFASLHYVKRNFNSSVIPYDVIKIQEILPDFDKKVFQNKVFAIYKKIQIAWMDFDYTTLRNYTTDELYNMYYSQLEALKIKKQKNMMGDFNLHDFEIVSIDFNEKTASLKIRMMIECYDYVVDEDNNVVRGNKKQKNLYDYEMVFIKGLSSSLDHCPSYGASFPEQQSIVCPYCQSTIINNSHGLVLAKKRILFYI